MANLRDKGFPQSRNTQNLSDKRKAIMNDNAVMDMEIAREMTDSKPVEQNPLVDTLVKAYTNKMFGTKAPRIHNVNYDYDDGSFERGYALRNFVNDRLGFASKIMGTDDNGDPYTEYNVDVDNIPLGEDEMSKSFNTPIGTLSAGYDGDGSVYGNFRSNKNAYMISALMNALRNRGQL